MEQINRLIEMQKKHFIASLSMDKNELKASYIQLGEYHYDLRIPYVDFIKGTQILEEHFLLNTQKIETTTELMHEIFGYFKIMTGFTAKGYLNRMLREDKVDIENYFIQSEMNTDTYLSKAIIHEKIMWLKNLLEAIETGNEVIVDTSNTLLEQWMNEVSFLSLEKRNFFEDLERRIVLNTQNLFYFLKREEYLEILPLYTSLLGIYKLTLMMNNAITIEYANHIIEDMKLDGLTGLFRKDIFEELLKKEIAFVWRDKNHTFTLLYLDLDNFKSINDTFGHYSGDKVIERLGETIKKNIRASDLAFRIGGDEFAIILKNTNSEDSKTVAKKIKVDFGSTEFVFNDRTVFNVSMSLGLSEYKDGLSYEQFIEQTDAKLYEAKMRGKNQIAL